MRKDRPCKAYLDHKADAGTLTEQEGKTLCDAVIQEWKRRIIGRWPTVVEQCAQSLGYMTLRGSRVTSDGLKTSYHVMFPWLVFPLACSTTMLHDEAGLMSRIDLQDSEAAGPTAHAGRRPGPPHGRRGTSWT